MARVVRLGATSTCGCAASTLHVAQAARQALRQGNAADAVLAGVLGAAASDAGVLLGPLQMVVAGAGAGIIALDGRVRQPGRGVPRPRGFTADEPIPQSALVAVPALPSTVAVAAAALGSISLQTLARMALAHSRDVPAPRAHLLGLFARRGALALAEEPVAAELLAVAGRAARGLLTRDDLLSVRPSLVSLESRPATRAGLFTPPWKSGAGDASRTQVVAAVDANGMAAVACYEQSSSGLPIPALGLVAPLLASPVMRGVPRVRPGEPRRAAAPIAVTLEKGSVKLAVGVAYARNAEAALDEWMDNATHDAASVAGATIRGRLVALCRSVTGVQVLHAPEHVSE
jgi:hypothetical protein